MAGNDQKRLDSPRLKDPDAQKVLEDTRSITKGLQDQSFAGTDVQVTFPAASDTTFAHRLGRVPRGYLPFLTTGGVALLNFVSADSRMLTLHHAGGFEVTVTMRVF